MTPTDVSGYGAGLINSECDRELAIDPRFRASPVDAAAAAAAEAPAPAPMPDPRSAHNRLEELTARVLEVDPLDGHGLLAYLRRLQEAIVEQDDAIVRSDERVHELEEAVRALGRTYIGPVRPGSGAEVVAGVELHALLGLAGKGE